MKQKYYAIIQDTLEVIELGEFESSIELQMYFHQPHQSIEHYTHGYQYIIVPRELIGHLLKAILDATVPSN